MYSLIADIILIIHFLFIAFVLAGQACIIIGYYLKWRWIYNFVFRVCHLAAITIVVVQSWMNLLCPLTIIENIFRAKAGEQAYEETFIRHWLGDLVFYDAPFWAFAVVYSLFGLVVLLSWFLIKPVRKSEHCG